MLTPHHSPNKQNTHHYNPFTPEKLNVRAKPKAKHHAHKYASAQIPGVILCPCHPMPPKSLYTHTHAHYDETKYRQHYAICPGGQLQSLNPCHTQVT
jgi:hypothetical protein